MKKSFLSFSILFFLLNLSFAEEEEKVKPTFQAPAIPESAYFADTIKPESIGKKWILSQAKKDGIATEIAKYDGKWSIEVPETSAVINDYSLILQSRARHHAISTKLDKPIKFDKDELIVQYEVKFQNGMECGGAYIKLLSSSADNDLSKFYDKTPFTIMFGPDKCGLDSKVHFIFRHKNPLTGQFEEKFVKSLKKDISDVFAVKKSHLFTLVLRKDNSFEIYIDQKLSASGDMLTDFEPPVNPPNEIDDPNDKKPEDWDEREKIPDATAVKPDDWDDNAPEFIIDEKAEKPIGWLDNEPPMINDPSAQKPEDWDSSIDGEWEPPKIENPVCKDADGCGEWKPPRIHNPAYKGKWSAPMIANPDYKGIWSPKKIPNPNYFEDKNPYTNLQDIFAVGLELWSMTEGVAFDNFFLTSSKADADKFAEETWNIKRESEEKNDPTSQSIIDYVKELASEKPWLIGIIVVGVIIFFVLIFYCLCRGGGEDDDEAPLLVDPKNESEKDQYSAAGAALSKKSDPKGDAEDSEAKDSDDENVDYDDDKKKSDSEDEPEVIDITTDSKPAEKPQEEKVRKRRARKD